MLNDLLARMTGRFFINPASCSSTREIVGEEGGKYHSVELRLDPEIPLPCNLREQDRPYFERLRKIYCPETFLAEMPGGFVHNEGVVISPRGQVCRDVCVAHGFEKTSHPVVGRSLLRWSKWKGITGVLASRGTDCYYHWMFDVLPRLELLEGRPVDRYLAPSRLPFQRDTLGAMGIAEKCIPTHEFGCREFETLFVPSLPSHSGMPNFRVCNYLRRKLLHSPGGRTRKLYISRGDVSKRQVLDEPCLIEELKRAGFSICQLGGMSHAAQVELFSSASIVVAPHGAALSNLVFCNPGVPVVELVHPRYPHWCYWYICGSVGLNYHYHVPGDSPALVHDHRFASKDVAVDTKNLLDLINSLA